MSLFNRIFTSRGQLATRCFSKCAILNNAGPKTTAISPEEMSHFNNLASSWWDVNGPQRILHKMNLLRMDFIFSTVREHVKLNENASDEEDLVYIPPYNVDLLPSAISRAIVEEQEARRDDILMGSKLSVLDVGCGGGILSESLARLNFIEGVKGIDLSSDVLEAAKMHQLKDPVLKQEGKLQYELKAIEDLEESETYDIVTLFEMLEHVDYPSRVLSEAMKRVNVGGWLFISTINRDLVSWFTTILMGEHILGIVPVGTHNIEKYIDSKEIISWIENDPKRNEQYKVVDTKGCIYLPATGWKFTDNPNIGNYFMAIKKIK